MSAYYPITLEEMTRFLQEKGFQQMDWPCQEAVFGKRVSTNFSLRIFTGIAHGQSRDCGDDAIRFVLAYRRDAESKPKVVGKGKKCLRVEGWKENMTQRIENWQDILRSPFCPKCNAPMSLRFNKKDEQFFGCVNYPDCKGTLPYEQTEKSCGH